MIEIKEIRAEQVYVFSGLANANSCFIETVEQGKIFLKYANYYLNGYLKVYDFIINSEGWVLVVKINSKEKILKKYKKNKIEIWRIISERMRLFLSTFVSVSNRLKGRTGCLVHSTYERYYFESIIEAKNIIKSIREQNIRLYNGIDKYKPCEEHYEVENAIGKGSIFLSKKVGKTSDERSSLGHEVLFAWELTLSVLEKMILHTRKLHSMNKLRNISRKSYKYFNSSG